MENQVSLKKTILNYGIILGVVSIIINLLNYSFGDIYYQFKSTELKADSKVMNIIIGVLSLIAMIAIIILAIKAYKKSNSGFLKLGQSVKLGLGIALIASIIGIIYQLILTKIIEPEFYNNAYNFMEEAIYEKYPDMSEEQLEMSLNMGKKFSGFWFTSAIGLAFSLILGLIISLIAGAFMKKDPETV